MTPLISRRRYAAGASYSSYGSVCYLMCMLVACFNVSKGLGIVQHAPYVLLLLARLLRQHRRFERSSAMHCRVFRHLSKSYYCDIDGLNGSHRLRLYGRTGHVHGMTIYRKKARLVCTAHDTCKKVARPEGQRLAALRTLYSHTPRVQCCCERAKAYWPARRGQREEALYCPYYLDPFTT